MRKIIVTISAVLPGQQRSRRLSNCLDMPDKQFKRLQNARVPVTGLNEVISISSLGKGSKLFDAYFLLSLN